MESLANKIVLITGASSGVGKACAEQFASYGANVILTARRLERLTDLAKELETLHSVKALPLQLDVSNKQQVIEVIRNLPASWSPIDILVNNAGVGVTTELMQNANPDDWDKIISTNINGLLYVTHAILPSMVERNSGHIINIGSASAHDYYRGGNVYSASKHAVRALTKSLRIDLTGYRIRVSEINPGMIKTEFSEVRWNKEQAEKFYMGVQPLIAADVADTVLYCATRPSNVNIAEITIYPLAQTAPTIVHRDNDSKPSGIFDR